MAGWIEKIRGYLNASFGKAKELAGRLNGSHELVAHGKTQLERGLAQIAWGRVNSAKARSDAQVHDEMMRKLNGQSD